MSTVLQFSSIEAPVWEKATLPFTQDQKERIVSAITQRAPTVTACPVCGNAQWTLADGLVLLPLQTPEAGIVLGGPGLPCAALTCTRCGNTRLLNLIVLGLRDLLEKHSGT